MYCNIRTRMYMKNIQPFLNINIKYESTPDTELCIDCHFSLIKRGKIYVHITTILKYAFRLSCY